MKTKYYTKMIFPLSLFGIVFRVLEIMFAIEPSSGFYYFESIIPMLFNIYILLVILFFLSEIFLIKTEMKSSRKRFGAVNLFDKFLMISSAVFILAGSLRDFLVELNVNFSYASFAEVFTDVKVYILILAVLSCIFMVFFAADPKRYSTSSFMALFSLSVTFYYLVRLFTRFLDLNDILSKAYSAHTIIFLGFMVLSFVNFSKVLAGLFARKYFVAFGTCAVFLAFLHLVEFVMYFIPGNPYNIPIDSIFNYIADFLCAILILRLVLLVSRKQDKKVSSSDDRTVVEKVPEDRLKTGESDPAKEEQLTEEKNDSAMFEQKHDRIDDSENPGQSDSERTASDNAEKDSES